MSAPWDARWPSIAKARAPGPWPRAARREADVPRASRVLSSGVSPASVGHR